ncbi:MAG: diphthamide synthesis protein [Nanoarchaeota archaeon]|nr:diphthamide synthesis protein [Nanoarchaeota archaeon]
MKTLFIDAKSDLDVTKVLKKVKVKGKVGLVTTVQHFHKLKDAKKVIPDSIIGGQVLGCDVSAAEKIKDKVDVFIYIGTGAFHPLGIALKTGKEVIIANPLTNEISKVSKKDVEDYKKRIKGKYLKFLSAEKIGILVSTKPGQYQLEKALKLQKKLGKPSYIFLANNFSENELENYPDIDIFVNTACPRMDFKKVINIEDIKLKD